MKAIDSHRLRAAVMNMMKSPTVDELERVSVVHAPITKNILVTIKGEKATYKKFLVGAKNKQTIDTKQSEYGLKDLSRMPSLSTELDSFYAFMIEPSPSSQEEPIRKTTADVYLRHCRLFLGWFLSNGSNRNGASEPTNISIDHLSLSLKDIFVDKMRESAEPVFRFIKWLRATRKVSVAYEANVLRGLTKLVKFRFSSGPPIQHTAPSFHCSPSMFHRVTCVRPPILVLRRFCHAWDG